MPDSVWSLLGMLALVVLILFGAYWVSRWVGSSGVGTGRIRLGGMENFRTLGQIPVGRNERLLLVRVQEHCYLLGVTASQITLLKELEQDEAKEWLAQEPRPTAPSFMDVLKDNLRKRK